MDVGIHYGRCQPKISESLTRHVRPRDFRPIGWLRMLNRLGQDVEIIVKPMPTGASRPARVMVAAG